MSEQLIILIVIAVISAGKWLLENADRWKRSREEHDDRSTSGPSSPHGEGATPQMRTPIPPRSESEEERMRRFMEALGLPTTGEGRPPPPPRPSLVPREPEPRSAPPVPGPRPASTPQPRQMAAPTRPFQQPPLYEPPVGPEPRPSNLPPARTAPMPLPGMARTPKAPPAPAPPPSPYARRPAQSTAGTTDSSAIGTLPSPFAIGQRRKQGGMGVELRRMLKGRASLRQALVLREVLGPPKAYSPLERDGSSEAF